MLSPLIPAFIDLLFSLESFRCPLNKFPHSYYAAFGCTRNWVLPQEPAEKGAPVQIPPSDWDPLKSSSKRRISTSPSQIQMHSTTPKLATFSLVLQHSLPDIRKYSRRLATASVSDVQKVPQTVSNSAKLRQTDFTTKRPSSSLDYIYLRPPSATASPQINGTNTRDKN